jgi:hypothetical protein
VLLIRIRDRVPFLPLDPGSGMRESQGPDPGRTFRIILGLETFFCLFGDPGSVLETVWIRKKHPGSATLPPTIPETMFLCTLLTIIFCSCSFFTGFKDLSGRGMRPKEYLDRRS